MKSYLIFLALIGLAASVAEPTPEVVPTALILYTFCGRPGDVVIVMSDGTYRIEDWDTVRTFNLKNKKVKPEILMYGHSKLCGLMQI